MSFRSSLEFISKALLAVPPEAVNNETVGSAGVGFSVQGFQSDISGFVLLGAMPATTDVDLAFEHAPLDADGSAPEAGDFAAIAMHEGSGNVVIEALATGDANKVIPFRIKRDLVKEYIRVTATNNVATDAIVGGMLLPMEPAYDSLNDVSNADFVLFK